jgi:enterochelin esterase family protein
MLHRLQGTVKILNHTSEVLRGNPLGDKHERELYVYLPPLYESRDGEKSFPVVYCLTGFTGRGKMLLNDNALTPNLAERMDKLIAAETIGPMIVVMPDCFTYYGGSQYINSSATGNYEDYLINEIVPFVDENFRTIADRSSRAVMGKSSGGYGALVNAMRHSDVFGLCASHAGDAYFEHCYLPDIPKAVRAIKGNPAGFIKRFWAKEKKGKDDFSALNILGMSSCYSPAQDAELGFDLPFDLQTGEIDFAVFSRWLEHDPVRMVEKYVDELKSLKLLYLDAGRSDEFALDIGARIFVSKLKESGIDHIHEEFDGGHFNIGYRYDRSLEMISQAIY